MRSTYIKSYPKLIPFSTFVRDKMVAIIVDTNVFQGEPPLPHSSSSPVISHFARELSVFQLPSTNSLNFLLRTCDLTL